VRTQAQSARPVVNLPSAVWARQAWRRLSAYARTHDAYWVVPLTSAAALAAALALAPEFNDAPGPIFLAGVLVSAWIGGLRSGLVVTAIAGVALARLFDLSRASILPRSEDTAFDLLLFLAVACLISWLTSDLRSTNRRLEAARAETQVAIRARDELAAAAAHDLKTPLAGISMAAQLARRRVERLPIDGTTGAAVARQLMDMQTSAQRMVGVLDELVELVQLHERKPLELDLVPTRLRPLVESAVSVHEASTDDHVIGFTSSADPLGLWDAARLTRVVDNLLSNAIKYSPAGSEIGVELEESVSADGRRVAELRVRDQGVGIPAGDIDHVFQPFYRSANVGSVAGSGIGLASARRIVDQHGGTLTVESEEGAGATFIVRLPVQRT
jgi:signal transduction histidine kinase